MKKDKNSKYGLLSYSTKNIGDEIQSLAARQFLPKVDVFLDRDKLNEVKSDKKIKLIMNGWFTEKPKNWPPSPDIDPLFIAFHLSEKGLKEMTSKESIEYFKKHEPIGCRDYHTRDILIKHGVDAYFSGCLTLTFEKKSPTRSDEILLVDLEREGIKINELPKNLVSKSKIFDHKIFNMHPKMTEVRKRRGFIRRSIDPTYKFMFSDGKRIDKRFKLAERYLERYARAKLVITSRIHCALPCLAMGTPVIFIHKNMQDPRFGGLLEYFRNYTPEEFKKKVDKIDWVNPLPNPKSIEKIRNNLVKKVNDFINN